MILRYRCSKEFSLQSSLIIYFWSTILIPLTLTLYIKTGKTIFLASTVFAIARNQLLFLLSSILAFSINIKSRRSPLGSRLIVMICLVTSYNSLSLITITSLRIFFLFISSLSLSSLIIIFSSLRFYSIYYDSLRSVAP